MLTGSGKSTGLTHSVRLDDGEVVTADLVRKTIQSRLTRLEEEVGELGAHANGYREAADVTEALMTSRQFQEHLTTTLAPAKNQGRRHIVRLLN